MKPTVLHPFFLFALCAILAFCGCTRPFSAAPLTKTGFFFNTVITVTIYGGSEELLDECFQMAGRYETMLSASDASGDISKINDANGKPVTVSSETAALLRKSLEYCRLSSGGFDITIGALSSLWDFPQNDGIVPDESRIAKAVSTIGYENVLIQGREACLLNPETKIDLGGIAKGYIADRMKDFFNENGVTQGIINLGGNVLCLGPKADKSRCRIGIQKPFSERGELAAVLDVTDQTVVSSGIYERYFESGNQLYHHILNPKTGYPFDNDLLSVTIVCKDSVDGDALSTVCFALGLTEGMELIESLPDTEAVFLTKDLQFHASSGIGKTIPFENRM